MSITEIKVSSTGESIAIRHSTKGTPESQARHIANEICLALMRIDSRVKRGGNFVDMPRKKARNWIFDITINRKTQWGSIFVPENLQLNYFFVTLPDAFKGKEDTVVEILRKKVFY